MGDTSLKEVMTKEDNFPTSVENNTGEASSTPAATTNGEPENLSPVINNISIDQRLANSPESSSSGNEGRNEQPVTDRSIFQSHDNLRVSEILFTQNSDVTSAISSLESTSTFSCKYPGCGFSSIDAEEYLKHEDTHVDGGSSSCDVCNLLFPTYAIMRRHHLYAHQGIRTFECHFCAKRFLRRELYNEHVLSHTKPRPYNCTFCMGSFSYRSQLKSHLATEHSSIALGKTCYLCDFKSSSPNVMKVHYATYHMKHNMNVPGIDTARNLVGDSIISIGHNEAGAVDLASVSQNFSFITSHYPSYSAVMAGSSATAGPSDLSRRAKPIHVTPSISGQRSLAQVYDPTVIVPIRSDDNRHICESSTVVSPMEGCESAARPKVTETRLLIKPEPVEISVDDSQTGNVQPTSTIEVPNSEVETTCEASGSSEIRRKVKKNSSTDDTGSESHNSPPARHYDFDSTPVIRNSHTCCRYRPYEDGSQRCREYIRHTCSSHRSMPDRRNRFSDDLDRNPQHHSEEERKIFYSRATSTHPGDAPLPRVHRLATLSSEDGNGCPMENNADSNSDFAFAQKSTIVIRDVESHTLTCVYCKIVFPDQTLYLLHRSLHSEGSPWKCNLCGKTCKDKYDFNSHVISKGHY